MNRSPQPPARASVWKRLKGWHLVVLAVLLLPVGFLFGLGNHRGPSEAERKVLRALESYGVRYELDDTGGVVRLVLEGDQVSDQALNEVANLPHLKRLSVHKSSVTDAGLLKLRNARRLQALGIANTRVTDRGLRHLEQMPSLRHVWVCQNDKLTAQGIASLRRTLPGVKVYVMNRAVTGRPERRAKSPGDKTAP